MLANSVLIIVTIVTRVCYYDILSGNIAMNTPGNLTKTRIYPTPSRQPCPVLQVKTTHHHDHLDTIKSSFGLNASLHWSLSSIISRSIKSFTCAALSTRDNTAHFTKLCCLQVFQVFLDKMIRLALEFCNNDHLEFIKFFTKSNMPGLAGCQIQVIELQLFTSTELH